MEETARPAPLAFGASPPSSPQAVSQATTLITVVQTQPRRRWSSRTVAATSGSESVTASSGDATGQG